MRPNEILIVGNIAHAGCDYELRIIALRMAFREEMLPGQAQPRLESPRGVKAAIDASEGISPVNAERVSTEGVR